jgi:NhaP-type Na+/H+ or K+/H+ antiporter
MVEPLLFWGGWLLLGLILARVAYYLGAFEDGETGDYVVGVALMIVAAPLVAVLAAVACTAYGAYRLVTLPTRAERRQRRQATLERERQHIRAEARRLGLPMLEDGEVPDAG